MVRRLELGAGVLAIGGLALNTGIVACLEELVGQKLIVPALPQIVSAIGAARIAAQPGGIA
jgi:activator of 2-hydroxyglutaryl-CoA dehydratase